MIIQPTKIITGDVGENDPTYGIGVITPHGAFVTGKIPPFERIYVTSYIPRNTIFQGMDGTLQYYNIPVASALGIQKFDIKPRLKTRHYFSITPLSKQVTTMNLHDTVQTDFNIVIKEQSPGEYSVYIQRSGGGKIFQPYVGWVWKNQ